MLGLGKLLEQLEEPPHRTMVRLVAATGLRIGELLAVRWAAVDLDAGTLAVRESVYAGKFQLPNRGSGAGSHSARERNRTVRLRSIGPSPSGDGSP